VGKGNWERAFCYFLFTQVVEKWEILLLTVNSRKLERSRSLILGFCCGKISILSPIPSLGRRKKAGRKSRKSDWGGVLESLTGMRQQVGKRFP